MQPDTLIPSTANPQSWNRYSYVQNRPVSLNDPSGHHACGDGEDIDCNGHKQDPNANPYEPHQPPSGGTGGGADGQPNGNGDKKDNCPPNDIACKLHKSSKEMKDLIDFCVHDPYNSSCVPLLPPETCAPIQMYQASGTPYNPPGCRYVGSKTYIDWNKIDKFDLAVDVSGIIGTIGLGLGEFGIIPGDVAYGISEAVQLFGLVHDVYKIQPGLITWDLVSKVAEENKTVGRLIPIVGMFINIGSIQDNLRQAEVTIPIYEPYPRPLPFTFP